MIDLPPLRQLLRLPPTVLYLLLMILAAVLLALGLRTYWREGSAVLLALGVLCFIIPASLWPIAAALARNRSPSSDQEIIELLRSINDRLLLSDAAKRIAYRQQDRNALRQAIQEEIAKEDYEAALVLVDEMAQQYGYREEAEKFREEILQARKARIEARIAQFAQQIQTHLDASDFHAARALAAKALRLFPDSPAAVDLDNRVKQAYEQYKQDLERRFLQAAERNEVDLAMTILKELDKHLTEAEAAPLREVARGVITKRRENLGAQFKFAVHDRDWTLAVHIGEQIIRDFPNTRMADEVRRMIDTLRARAAEQQAARSSTPKS